MVSGSKPKLSLSFHNFFAGHKPHRSFFTKALSQAFDVELSAVGRDVQLSSVFGRERLPDVAGARPLRIWWTGEAADPGHQTFDLYFGFRPAMPLLASRWHRFPYWVTQIDWWDEGTPITPGGLTGERRLVERSRFCNFIYSSTPSVRTEFFARLDQRRPVASFGRVLNNQGRAARGRRGKMQILEESRFTIAFENQIAPGYVTEKLIEPLSAGSVPIYWGAPEAKSDFNPDSFIAAADFASMEALVDHVLEIADSPTRYREIALAPPFPGNKIPYRHTPDFFVDRVREALSGTLEDHPWNDRPWRSSEGVPPRRRVQLGYRAFRAALRLRLGR